MMNHRQSRANCKILSCLLAAGLFAVGEGRAALGQPAVSATGDTSGKTVAGDPAAEHFTNTCSGCHTVGAGASRGPDLLPVSSWPEPQLNAAIRSMERKVGPLTEQQVTALIGLLKDANARDRLAIARAQLTATIGRTVAPADSLLGGALFYGHLPLENGGMACSSCHRFRGEGGNLGPDLSHFADNANIDLMSGSVARASFAVMRSAYQPHPILEQEARHIVAFMQQAKAPRKADVLSDTTSLGVATGLIAVAVVVAFIFSRPKSVRVRLVQRALKR